MHICNSIRLRINRCGNSFKIRAICLILLWGSIEAIPQDMLGTIGLGVAQIAGQAGDIISNGAALRDDRGFELPFAKAHSMSEAGFGEAMIQRHDSDSSEEDRRRRKRSVDAVYSELMLSQSLLEMESLLPQPHFHRFKRTPCFSNHGTTTGGGTGTTGGGDGDTGDDDDVVLAERRRKAAARRRARQKAKSRKSKKTKTKKLIGEVGDAEESASRRKRQTEVDDLTANMNSTGKDISQHAQQFAEKVRGLWENMVNSMNEMAARVKEAFKGATGGGDQTTGEI